MKFKKGSMVEVFCQNENPGGSWRCAEIVRGDGHNFTVKYDSGVNQGLVEERVVKKFIRPSSPNLEFLENWKSGDVIEVLHNLTWKMATVSKVLSGGKFLVSLVGFSDEFEVSKSNIRLRQSWMDGKWIVIGKRSQMEPLKHNPISGYQISRPISKISLQQKSGHVMYKKNNNLRISIRPSTRILKRKSPNCRSEKLRGNKKDGNHYPVYFENVSQFPEKGKGNTFDRDTLGENILPLFPNGRMRNLSGTNGARTKGHGNGYSSSVSSGKHDNDDGTCSTSCSSVCSNDPFNWWHKSDIHPSESGKDCCTDAESICCPYNEETSGSSFTKEELAAETHRLELHAYRCTMEALHASGPLSWEKESLITNLRISLHISNDEHLMELRTLISKSRKNPIS